MTAVDTLWIRCYHPRPDAEVRLVCLPHAGGSSSFYFPMSRAMPDSVEVAGVQYPGRQDRRTEPCPTTIQDLADRVTAALVPWADRPLLIFGHSMGATLGFEVARRLERDHGIVPAGLIASARRAPSRHREENIHERDDAGLIAEMRTLSGTDSAVLDDEELIRMALPAIRADYRAAETYRYEPGPPLNCPIVGLTGDADPKVTVDETASWAEHTTASFDMTVFDGGHFYLTRHQAAVSAIVARAAQVAARA